MKPILSILLTLLVCVFLFLSTVFILKSFLVEKKTKEYSYRIKTTCTLVGDIWAASYSGVYQYKFKNNVRSYEGESYKSQIVGDKYIIYYNDVTDRTRIMYHQPIFLDTENTKSTKGKIVSAHPWYSSNYVKFEYKVNGTKYLRLQRISEDFESKYPNVKKGQKYLVKYWMKNPQRSIMNFDEPIK